MSIVTLKIDGTPVEVDSGTTILEAAEKIGAWIPTLCHHKAMIPTGSCRICMVAVEQNGASRVVPSCVTKVSDGMTVLTDSDDVKSARATVAELLLARCPNIPEIIELCRKLGVSETVLEKYDVEEACILCGRCVQICHEVMEVGAIDFIHRGPDRKIEAPFDTRSEICQECGACAYVCPTGKLQPHDLWGHTPDPLRNTFEEDLCARPNIHMPFPSAVPSVPVINRDNCIHFKTGKCGICETVCQPNAIDYDQEEEETELEVGAVVLSPGFKRFDPGVLGELGFGRFPNVVTSMQFERILSASGPYEGEVKRPSDGKHPRRIAFLQCVGSRDQRTHTYCSAFCCMQATKEAIIAKEHDDNIESTIFYMDIRSFGKGFEDYRNRAENEVGVRYIRSQISSVKEDYESQNVIVDYVDPVSGKRMKEEFDLLILSVGIVPSPAGVKLAEKFGVEMDDHGFCKWASFAPVDTKREGVFVTGAFAGPKDIPETVAQASAAAGRVAEYLAASRGTEVVPVTFPEPRDVSGEEPRIGVFVCHCGINIAGTVNVQAVEEYAATLPYVVYVQRTLFTCSQDSITNIRKVIEEQNLNRVVVASCTPRTHEPIFQDTLREAGLNPYLFEMANIREQCAWVHKDEPVDATEKAKELVTMIVSKAKHLESLESSQITVKPRGIVIGGGVAGIITTLALAGQGYVVHLIEKSDRLGGLATKFDRTNFGEDISSKLDELIRAVEQNTLIKLYLNADVSSVSGHVGNFIVNTSTGESVDGGAIVVTTGAKEYVPTEYNYGKHDGIMTQLELEEKFHGKPFEFPAGKSVVMIQCVGSRCEERTYCSRVCCTHAIKNAMRIRRETPDVTPYVLYRDIRTYGIYEDLYRAARKAGVVFLRFDENDPPEVDVSGEDPVVRVNSPDLHDRVELNPSHVILSAAVVALEENEELAKVLKVSTTQEGFFLEAHIKLRPVDFASEGIFVAGLAHAPKTFDEAIGQALAAAGRAGIILSKKHLDSGAIVAKVQDTKCIACLTCVRLCPYDAPILSTESGVVRIEEVKCQGCGLCAGACPAKAIQLAHYKDDQIDSILDSIAAIQAEKSGSVKKG